MSSSWVRRVKQVELVRRWGHYWQTYPALVLAVALPVHGWWRVIDVPLLAAAVFWISVAQGAHHEQSCPQCIAGWPANPSAVAEQRARWLWWYHFGYVTIVPVSLLVLLVLVLSVSLLTTIPALLVIVAAYSSHARSARLHADLAPWCRWCRRDDGDGDEAVEPTPTPSAAL